MMGDECGVNTEAFTAVINFCESLVKTIDRSISQDDKSPSATNVNNREAKQLQENPDHLHSRL